MGRSIGTKLVDMRSDASISALWFGMTIAMFRVTSYGNPFTLELEVSTSEKSIIAGNISFRFELSCNFLMMFASSIGGPYIKRMVFIAEWSAIRSVSIFVATFATQVPIVSSMGSG